MVKYFRSPYLVKQGQGVDARVEVVGLGHIVAVPVGHAAKHANPPLTQRVIPRLIDKYIDE